MSYYTLTFLFGKYYSLILNSSSKRVITGKIVRLQIWGGEAKVSKKV